MYFCFPRTFGLHKCFSDSLSEYVSPWWHFLCVCMCVPVCVFVFLVLDVCVCLSLGVHVCICVSSSICCLYVFQVCVYICLSYIFIDFCVMLSLTHRNVYERICGKLCISFTRCLGVWPHQHLSPGICMSLFQYVCVGSLAPLSLYISFTKCVCKPACLECALVRVFLSKVLCFFSWMCIFLHYLCMRLCLLGVCIFPYRDL